MFPQCFPVSHAGNIVPVSVFVFKMKVMLTLHGREFKRKSEHASTWKNFASTSTHLIFASNLSKGQILWALSNWMGPFDTPTGKCRQTLKKLPGISVKARKREYLERYCLFSENIPPGWTVPFEFSPELPPENSIQMVSAQDIFESDDVAKSCPVSCRIINQYGGTTCRHSFSRVNPDAIGCVWTGEFDLNTLRVDREIF